MPTVLRHTPLPDVDSPSFIDFGNADDADGVEHHEGEEEEQQDDPDDAEQGQNDDPDPQEPVVFPAHGWIKLWRPMRDEFRGRTQIFDAMIQITEDFSEIELRQFILRTWPDLETLEWAYVEVEETYETSSLIPRDEQHLVVFDRLQFPRGAQWRATLVELEHFDRMGVRIDHFLMGFAVVAPLSKPSFLAQLGLEARRRQTFLDLNGQPLRLVDAAQDLPHGSFLFLSVEEDEEYEPDNSDVANDGSPSCSSRSSTSRSRTERGENFESESATSDEQLFDT